jgi:D-alanyl-D-alanine carboxypeptidase
MKKLICFLLLSMTIVALVGLKVLSDDSDKNLSQAIEATDNKDKINNETKAVLNNSYETSTKKDVAQKNVSAKTSVLLVNKSNKLTQGYIPENLRVPNVKFISYADPSVKKMESEAADALEKLFNAALKDGINLLAVSGYRTYSYQEKLYNNKVKSAGKIEADKYVAQPGASEHQTGLAMDVLSSEYSTLDDGFANTKAYKWLKENCFKYGFIIRYPKEKQSVTKYNFEPWHIRYVGSTASMEMAGNNLTLEEYLNNKV